MSWPQWSQQAAPPMGPMPPMPTAVAPPVVNPAPPVVQPVAPPQYTQEQWSQMQQQNWTQWAQWQQQYQQWHQQYGAEYQKSMNAIAQASQPQQPMLPNMGVPPPPPQAELKPPLPTEQPPPPAPNYPPAAPLQPMNLFNQSAPPPPPVKQAPQPATNFQRTNANWSNQQPPRYNEPLKRNFDQQNEYDAKRHVPNNRQWQQGTSSGNQSQTQNQPPALMSLSIKPVDQRPKDNTEQLSEAEKKFDKQFKDWEAQFNKWKEQNSAHPDKEQYREYEKKWENWREQLLERREQMRRKRLGLAADPPKNSPQTTKTVSLNAQNQPAGQVQTKQRNEPTQPNMIPPRNEPSQVFNRAQIQDDRIFGDNRGSQNFKDSIESSRNVESPSMQDAPHLFQKPPPNLNDEPLQFKNKSSPSTQENEPNQSLPVGDFIKPSEGGGIPGLDLVKYGEQSECEEKENEIAENEKKNVALEAISKGINNILGDQKLLNMLSLVTQGQGQKLRDNVTNIQAEIKDPGVDGSIVPAEQSNSSFDDPSLREGPQREAIHNFDDQTRSSFTTGQPEQFDNNPSLLHNERQLGPSDRSGVQPNNANFSQFGQGPGPNMFGPNNNKNNLGFDRGPMRNFEAMDGPNRNSFDFNEGPNRGGFAPNEGSNRNNERPNQDTFGPRDGPRGNFRSNEGPRGNFGPNDPLKSNLGPNSGTRGNFAQNDGPRGNFRPNEGPRSNFGANDGPRRNFGPNDGPRGNFGPNDGPSPRGNFGPNDGPSPRGNFGPNDGPGPRGNFGPNDGPSPRGNFGPNDGPGPRGNFGPNDGPSPRGNFGPNDGPSPRGSFGPNDGPSPRGNFGPNDGPSPRGNIGTKDGPSPRGNFGPNDGPSPRGSFGPNDDFSPIGNFGPNDGPSPRSNFSPNDAPGPRGNFDANDDPTPRGNFGPNDGPNPRGNFGPGDFPRGNFGPNDGPRGYFGPNDGPRGNFGPNDGPPRGNFGPNDGPKSGFGPNDGPRNNFGAGEGQRGNFVSNDGPMGNFGTRDASWGNFGPRDGPRGPFRPNDGPNQGPRGNFNANDGPRGKFDNEPWRFPDGPKNNFGPNNFSRRSFGPNDGPRGGFESNDDAHNFGSNDDLRDNFGPNDGPRNSFGSNDGSQPHSTPNERHCSNFGPNDRSDSTGNYDNYDDDQYAESNFYEDDWDEPKENVPNPPTIPKPTEELLQPATVIDYEHKSIKTDDEFEVLIEPLHKFDYRHTSLRRIPFPQRPQWLNETVRNIMEFEPPRVQLRTLFPPPVESWSGERYPDENRHRYDNRPPYEQQQKRFYDNRRYERGRFEEKRFEENMRFEEDVGFEDNKNYNDSKEQFKDNSRGNVTTLGLAEDVLSDPEWPDDDAEGEPFKKIQKTETGKQVNKSNKIFIEDILNPPGRYNRPPRIVIILRGPPGSGKTFLAKLIKDREVENGGSAPRILSLDDYFMVEQEKEITEDGKLVKIKEMVYEYEAEMEESYRTSLMKSFKKTITDGYFSFIIVDNVNDKVKYFGEMWSFAKQHGFQVYICQMDLDVHTCSKRNIHDRTEEEIENCVCGFEPTPSHHPVLDATSLLQSVAIPEVEMEEVNSPENEMDESDAGEDHVSSSKWDNFDCSLSNLARLDGLSKPLRPSRTMEEYLQMDTEWTPTEPTKPGQKRVRWADLEEQKQQRKMREIGFVVGHTNWERMMDPTEGGSALTQTKYIEKTGRFKVSDFR